MAFHALALESAPLPDAGARALGVPKWKVRTATAAALTAPRVPTLVRVRTGVGPIAARRCAEALPPDLAIEGAVLGGFAGGLAPELEPGTIVIADPLLDAEGRTIPTPLAPALAQAAAAASLPHVCSPLVTMPVVLQSAEAKAALRARTGAAAVDMESAALARVLAARGVPTAAARVVLDRADEEIPPAGGVAVALAAALRRPTLLWTGLRVAARIRPCARMGSRLLDAWLASAG